MYSRQLALSSALFHVLFFETVSHYVAWTGFEPAMPLSQPPEQLGSQACVPKPEQFLQCEGVIKLGFLGILSDSEAVFSHDVSLTNMFRTLLQVQVENTLGR